MLHYPPSKEGLIGRHALTDEQYTILEPLLPGGKRRGRPCYRPRQLAGGRAYAAERIRRWLRERGIRVVIPPRRQAGPRRHGRPLSYDVVAYRKRKVIERWVGWLKECRLVATLYERLAVTYLGLVQLAVIQRYLRVLTASARSL